jgi:predicted aminopeptidase
MLFRLLIVTLPVILLSGCSTLGFYVQAIGGELSLLTSRRPIKKVIADPGTPPALQHKLKLALEIRRFASAKLGLPKNGSYKSYVALERPYVSWAVFATPEFSLKPKTWCYPFAGCVAYRGYFDKGDAQSKAAELRQQGDDVYVSGVPAFSTLGWFADPLTSTMMDWSNAQLAALIFHELTHQRVYVEGATDFNEAFATTVADVGVTRWLKTHNKPRALANYRRSQKREAAVTRLMLDARHRLHALYASQAPAAKKRRRKAAILARLRERYGKLLRRWGEKIKTHDLGVLNNARLAAVSAYRKLAPAFRALLAKHRGNLPAFYKAVEKLGDLPKAKRKARLRR